MIVIEEPDEESLGDLLKKLDPGQKGASSKDKGPGRKRAKE